MQVAICRLKVETTGHEHLDAYMDQPACGGAERMCKVSSELRDSIAHANLDRFGRTHLRKAFVRDPVS
jgi:hypothetical protein